MKKDKDYRKKTEGNPGLYEEFIFDINRSVIQFIMYVDLWNKVQPGDCSQDLILIKKGMYSETALSAEEKISVENCLQKWKRIMDEFEAKVHNFKSFLQIADCIMER